MIAILLVVLGAANLTAPFGEASAMANDDGTYIEVTVEVTIDPSYGADYVVVHLLNPEGQETFTLGAVPGGRYVGQFSILPFNRAVVFEAGRDDDFVQSTTVSLLDLGVEAGLLQTTYRPPGAVDTDNRWGWLALGASALAGAALLAWFLLPKPAAQSGALVDPSGDGSVVIEE